MNVRTRVKMMLRLRRLHGTPRHALAVGLAAIAVAGLTGSRTGVALTKALGEATATPNPFADMLLYVDPTSPARAQAEAWRTTRPAEAKLMERIAGEPTAAWIGDWNADVKRAVDDVVTRVTKAGALPVLVAYNIPARDCGLYSAGGASSSAQYEEWISSFADGLRERRSVVILEPDAVAAQCLEGAAEAERMRLIRASVVRLRAENAAVYIDAGNPTWHSAEEIADRLRRAGIDKADGFALNVSNFYATTENIRFGERLSRLLGGKHFVIDTSRNGHGSAGNEWCNPEGRGLGASPTVATGNSLVDAFLWIKRPGESDGTCNGGPPAGQWFSDYALELAQRQRTAS